MLPLELGAERARFATPDPTQRKAVAALKMIYGARLELVVASDRDIEAAFDADDAAAAEQTPAETAPEEAVAQTPQSELDHLLELANNAPTIRFVETLFADALARRATDIHLEPLNAGPRVRLRIDGILAEGKAPSAALYRGVVSRLKILADLDVAERRLPQDGRIGFRTDGRRVDIRMATAPTIFGEAITLRFLDTKTGLTRLETLEMPADVEAVTRTALAQPNGIVLVTGPTGSGKTTTLHAALSELNETGRKIVTIENPVEIITPGLIQIEVNPGLGWNFADALRTILRHDPDVLMVGEIRDEETAEMAVRLALTGHLVFSTLHTNSAFEAVSRLGNLGVPDYLMAAVLRMVASQRLVRRLCPECKRPAGVEEARAYEEAVARSRVRRPHWSPPASAALAEPVGCEACNDQGFRGRVGVFEALDAGAALAALKTDAEHRHRTMGEHGLERIAAGETTLGELMRVVGPPEAWV